jgi:hypothetical protein
MRAILPAACADASKPEASRFGETIMGKKATDIVQSAGFSEAPLAIPTGADYAKSQGDSGMGGAERYARIPRLKLIQAMSDKDLKRQFGEGAVVLAPDNLLIAGAPTAERPTGEPFVVIPLAFVTTYERRAVHGGDSPLFVLEATRDDKSQLARDCRNPDAREVLGPDGKVTERKYEVLNVIAQIDSGPLKGQFGVLSFASSGIKDGRSFVDRVARLRSGYKCYLQRVALRVGERSDDKNTWWGLDVGDPPDGVIVTQDRVEKLTTEAEAARSMIAAGVLDRAPAGGEPDVSEVPI